MNDVQPPEVDQIRTAMRVLAEVAGDSNDAAIAVDKGGRIASWNAAAERLFGYPGTEAIGMHISMLVSEEHEPRQRRILGQALAGSRVERFEGWRVTKDRRVLDVSLEVAPLLDGEGTVIGASKTVREITDVHESRRMQAHLAAIVNDADDAIITKDVDGTIVSWNPAAERLFGYEAREAIGQPIALVIPEDLQQREIDMSGEIVTGHHVHHFETRRVSKSGRLLDVSLTESPLRDGTGDVIGVSLIIRDVTEQNRAAARLRQTDGLMQANAELAAADRLKDQFLAMASHEMRTPLTAITGFTKTLQEMWSQLTEVQKQEFVSIIDAQAHRLQRLIDDLLTMAHIERGGGRSRSERIRVADALARVVRELGTEVAIDCPTDLHARADEDQLQQILTNLIGNAVKYGAPPIAVSARLLEDSVEIRVTDQGSGVPKNFVPHLFERFSRAGNTDTRIAGTGLGLSITRGLAHAQGGHVSYEPNQPRGSCFIVQLPTPDGSPVSRERRALPDRRRSGSRRRTDAGPDC
ncbi:MAG: hypothetical protein JWM98_3424 [Thermoleophilia bacterium]|nr:hypothetical protein [Thermoleophilia bacterium]